MKFDRNTVLGFVILAALFFGYFYFTNQQQAESRKLKEVEAKAQRAKADSIKLVNKPYEDSLNKIKDSVTQKNADPLFLVLNHFSCTQRLENFPDLKSINKVFKKQPLKECICFF